jgi:ubiquinone/menaquinone biosynthesis C-methylase UbiE
MTANDDDATRTGYNRVAAEYARRFADELDHKPVECALLDAFLPGVTGRICDLGCGPGQVAAYLHARGRDVVGVDLADQMVEQARHLHPDIPFMQADMRHLPFADASLAGIIAFYCLIHIPHAEIPTVLAELHRVLQPRGEILIGFHVGQETRHVDEWFGETVNVDFRFFTVPEMQDWLAHAHFTILATTERDPYPEIEVQTRHAYIRARKNG